MGRRERAGAGDAPVAAPAVATAAPQQSARRAARHRRGPWWQAAALFVLLIGALGIVPVALAGEVLGVWRLAPRPPYVQPLGPGLLWPPVRLP